MYHIFIYSFIYTFTFLWLNASLQSIVNIFYNRCSAVNTRTQGAISIRIILCYHIRSEVSQILQQVMVVLKTTILACTLARLPVPKWGCLRVMLIGCSSTFSLPQLEANCRPTYLPVPHSLLHLRQAMSAWWGARAKQLLSNGKAGKPGQARSCLAFSGEPCMGWVLGPSDLPLPQKSTTPSTLKWRPFIYFLSAKVGEKLTLTVLQQIKLSWDLQTQDRLAICVSNFVLTGHHLVQPTT